MQDWFSPPDIVAFESDDRVRFVADMDGVFTRLPDSAVMVKPERGAPFERPEGHVIMSKGYDAPFFQKVSDSPVFVRTR